MKNEDFGILGVFEYYTYNDLIKDLRVPAACGILFAIFQYNHPETLEKSLDKLLNYAIVYLPVMATIILTAYTMMIGALKSSLDLNKVLIDLSKKGLLDDIDKTAKDIENLRTKVSASFAASIFISIIALGICWLMYFIEGFEIVSKHALEINVICYGLVICFIVYPIVAMIGIISDMFSISRI